MAQKLQIKPEECSPLGKFVLQYMKEHNLSMREISRAAGLSQPGLRSVCLGTYPTDSTLQKLAQALKKPPLELYDLAYGRKVKKFQGDISPHRYKVEKFQEDIDPHICDEEIIKELLSIARKIGLEEPTNIPSNKKIRKTLTNALTDLGFSSAS